MDPTNSCSLMHRNRLQHLVTVIYQNGHIKTVRAIIVLVHVVVVEVVSVLINNYIYLFIILGSVERNGRISCM